MEGKAVDVRTVRFRAKTPHLLDPESLVQARHLIGFGEDRINIAAIDQHVVQVERLRAQAHRIQLALADFAKPRFTDRLHAPQQAIGGGRQTGRVLAHHRHQQMPMRIQQTAAIGCGYEQRIVDVQCGTQCGFPADERWSDVANGGQG